jgi:predicted RNA-binding Zn-ribbon protein involved in translation (DUF1610 family)
METRPPDEGSLALVYGCDDCGYEMAMLTNPQETEVVGSLGVELGPDGKATESRCPFTGVVREMTGAAETAQRTGFPWTEQALERLATIPEFVRPMAKTGIEKFARDRGLERVDENILDEAKDYFGM